MSTHFFNRTPISGKLNRCSFPGRRFFRKPLVYKTDSMSYSVSASKNDPGAALQKAKGTEAGKNQNVKEGS